MSERIYYKATGPDGTSFRGGIVYWAVGEVTKHPNNGTAKSRTDAADYLSVSDSPTNCTGFSWPCRLFVVEPVGSSKPWRPHPDDLPNKWAARRWRVVEELPAHLALGPQGEQIAALVERARSLTGDEVRRLDAAGYAAKDAAWALVARDLILREYYDALTRPWRDAIGAIHPDDED